MPPRLIIGLGTGRCGSVSLATLLNTQPDCNVSHEHRPLLPWEVDTGILEKKLRRLYRRKAAFIGDVASSWLPYVGHVLARHEDARFICLQRDREATVISFIRKLKGKKNHWVRHDGKVWRRDRRWDPCFPKYEAVDLATAIGRYWDDYYAEIDRLCRSFPNNVGKWPMETALNSREGITGLLTFAGIDPAVQVAVTGIRENPSRLRYLFRRHD